MENWPINWPNNGTHNRSLQWVGLRGGAGSVQAREKSVHFGLLHPCTRQGADGFGELCGHPIKRMAFMGSS